MSEKTVIIEGLSSIEYSIMTKALALSETIESQKQTIDALLKKHAAMQESRDELLEALDLALDPKTAGQDETWKIGRSAIAKAKGE